MTKINLTIDFGSSNTNIYIAGCGIVLSEPTVLAVTNDKYHSIKACGIDAKRLVGKTAENTKIVFPVFHGDIVNEVYAKDLLKYFLAKIEVSRYDNVSVVFTVPTGLDTESLKKYRKLSLSCGINRTAFVEIPIASAVGQQIVLTEFTPYFVIDMGGGVTNIAAVSLDGIIAGLSINIGGADVDAKLIDYIAEKYKIQIGLLTAEKIKISIGSLLKNDISRTLINGRDTVTGRPVSKNITAGDILEPMKMYFDKIYEFSAGVLSKLPAEAAAEIRHSGIYISGGLANTVGLEEYYQEKFQMKINIAESPEMASVMGGGMIMCKSKLLEALKTNVD